MIIDSAGNFCYNEMLVSPTIYVADGIYPHLTGTTISTEYCYTHLGGINICLKVEE